MKHAESSQTRLVIQKNGFKMDTNLHKDYKKYDYYMYNEMKLETNCFCESFHVLNILI